MHGNGILWRQILLAAICLAPALGGAQDDLGPEESGWGSGLVFAPAPSTPHNSAFIVQQGNLNELLLLQQGELQSAFVQQWGQENRASIEQKGFAQSVEVIQVGTGNAAEVIQQGQSQTIHLRQWGDYQHARVVQTN